MKPDTQAKFDAIFARHNAVQRAAADKKHAIETKEAVFLRQFLDARETVMRPAMQAIGDTLKANGYDFGIVTSEDGDDAREGEQRARQASIRLEFLLGEAPEPPHEPPGFMVSCDKGKQLVRFYESTIRPGGGGRAGPCGETELSGLTADRLQEEILHVVEELFR